MLLYNLINCMFLMSFAAPTTATDTSELEVDRHPVSVLNEYGQKNELKVRLEYSMSVFGLCVGVPLFVLHVCVCVCVCVCVHAFGLCVCHCCFVVCACTDYCMFVCLRVCGMLCCVLHVHVSLYIYVCVCVKLLTTGPYSQNQHCHH